MIDVVISYKNKRSPQSGASHSSRAVPTVLRVLGVTLGALPWAGTHSSAAEMSQAWACPCCLFQAGFPCACHRYLCNETSRVSGSQCPLCWLGCKGSPRADIFPGGASPAFSVLFSLFPPLFHFSKGDLLASVPQNNIYRSGCSSLGSASTLSC